MKLLLSLLFIIPFFTKAQQVNLHIHHEWMGNPFTLDTPGSTSDGEVFKYTLLKYYVTGITITHDGGNTTTIPDFVTVVDAADGISVLNLGTPAVSTIEAIEFYIGVDSARNHNDPSAESASSPLSFQSPSMHWGWASGYRFILLEGLSGNAYDQIVQIHTLGDENYRAVNLSVSAELVGGDKNIHVVGEYQQALRGMTIMGGLVNHGFTGEAALLANNFSQYVFSPQVLSIDEFSAQNYTIYPNPSTGKISINGIDDVSDLTIVDVYGKEILQLNSAVEINSLEINSPGIYFCSIHLKSGQQVSQKLIIE